MTRLEEIVSQLPPELQREVEDFAQFLADRNRLRTPRKLNMKWAGALSEFKDQYRSGLELQKKALQWWGT